MKHHQGERIRWGRARRGVALLNAMLLLAVMTVMMVVGINLSISTSRVAQNTGSDSQAYNVARAGLTDAIQYFKRLPAPVPSFVPTPDPGGAETGDTYDPYGIDPGGAAGKSHLGIVREYLADPASNLWARYEVGKVAKLDRDSKGKLRTYQLLNGTNWVGLSAANSNNWEGVQDVSNNYGFSTAGTVWRIRSHGYVYRRGAQPNSNGAGPYFYQDPNLVLAHTELETEIRRLVVKDYSTSLIAKTLNTTDNDSKIVFNGGSGNPAVRTNSIPSPSPTAGSNKVKYNGSTSYATYTSATYDLSWNEALGVPDGLTFAALAEYRANSVAELPYPLPTLSIVYLKPSTGTAIFSGSTPLTGGGLLVVDGNLRLAASKSLQHGFAGMIYVAGDYEQYGKSSISGQVVVSGAAKVGIGSGGKTPVNVTYDKGRINTVRAQLEKYRESRSPYRPD